MPFVVQPLSDGMLFESARRVATEGLPANADPLRTLGWSAVLVPLDAGGAGGNLHDLCAIVEGLALGGVRVPVIERAAVAPLLLSAVRDTERVAPLLREIAEGRAVQPLVGNAGVMDFAELQAASSGQGWQVRGRLLGVDDSLPAHTVLLLARAAGGPTLFHLPASALPEPHARYLGMDGMPVADYHIQLSVPDAARLAYGEAVQDAMQQAQGAALLAVCVDTIATAGAALSEVIAYLGTRVQFGAPLATQQALRHRVADAYVRYESARGMVASLLARCQGCLPPPARDLALVKCALGETARVLAEDIIQLHGGMGMSLETPAARLAVHLMANEFRYGDRWQHATALRDATTDGADALDPLHPIAQTQP